MKSYAIVGLAAAVGLSACSRGRATQQEAAPSTATENADRPVTVVGCLVPAATTTQSDAGRPSGTPPPPSFTLVDVTTPASGSAAPYTLIGDKDRLDDLQRFANSRVEVSGSIVAAAPPGDERRMRVKDVRQLESKCAAKKQ